MRRVVSTLRYRSALSRPWHDESGSGTVFFLFAMAICLMLAGLSLDAGNAWRQREVLRLSADVAAHAGASVLAKGGSGVAARVAALHATDYNTPESRQGRVIYDPFEDVRVVSYDPATNHIVFSGPANAVAVRLQRNDRVRNPVPTFLLGLVGLDNWQVDVESVAALLPTERCVNGSGVYARGKLTLEGVGAVGEGACLHSQDLIQLMQPVTFAKGAGVSMPDLNDCAGMCDNATSAGFDRASAEMNLITPKVADHVGRLAEGFADPLQKLDEEAAFFAAHELAEDLSALDEIGVGIDDLTVGDVVDLDREMFLRARALPSGLVYNVRCGSDETESDVLAIGSVQVGELAFTNAESLSGEIDAEGEDGGGGGEPIPPSEIDREEPEDAEAAAAEAAADAADEDDVGQEVEDGIPPRLVLDGVAVVTDCALKVTDRAELRHTLLISTRVGLGDAVTADPEALAGDPDSACSPAHRATIMALGGMTIPSEFAASNVAFVIGGDVHIGGAGEATILHRGLALHATGSVYFAGQHAFEACPGPTESLLPALSVIKYVAPADPFSASP